NQQPMVRRNQRDSTPVDQAPSDDLWVFLLPRGVVQRREQVFAREVFVQVSQETKETSRVTIDQVRQSAPVVRANLFGIEDFMKCADGPGNLRSGAAVGIPEFVTADLRRRRNRGPI